VSFPIANHPQLPLVAGPHITAPPVTVPNLFGSLGSDGTWTVGRTAWWLAGSAASASLIYHGYKRNDSVGWALVWGLLGGLVWPVTVPIAVAQGFGKRKR
jgi:hypothetical protein